MGAVRTVSTATGPLGNQLSGLQRLVRLLFGRTNKPSIVTSVSQTWLLRGCSTSRAIVRLLFDGLLQPRSPTIVQDLLKPISGRTIAGPLSGEPLIEQACRG